MEEASEAAIRPRHILYVEGYGFNVYSGAPRFNYCHLLVDRYMRSILGSGEPRKLALPSPKLPQQFILDERGGMVGYVNVIDCEFDPESPESDFNVYYRRLVRLHLDCLFQFV
jgi:hypothetical protein